MESFEEVGLAAELVEALASEGIERPTPLQEAVIPLVRRGNNVLAAAGPGAGTLVAYGTALLARLEPDAESRPSAVILVPTRDAARRSALSLARLAAATGLSVGALGSAWVLPERARILFSTPADLLGLVEASGLDLSSVETLVVDGAAAVAALGALDSVERIMEIVPADAQRVLVALPVSPEIEELATRRLRRAVHVPPRPAGQAESSPARGSVKYRTATEPKEEDVLVLVAELLQEGTTRHAVLFFRSEDRAADFGDFLTLHGYTAGAPGDAATPVWLAVDELEALPVLEAAGADVTVVSVDVPNGPDALDRRHGGKRGGTIVVLPREIPHLKDTAKRTGYGLSAARPPAGSEPSEGLGDTVARIEEALISEDVDVYLTLLEPLFRVQDPAQVAAAAVALLRKRAPAKPITPGEPSTPPSRGAAFVRIYMGLGSRDDAGPGDILGAITGETGLDGSSVGRIDIRESFSVVEVAPGDADQIIRSLNGTTVKGRSLRVDYDRPARTGGRRGPARK